MAPGSPTKRPGSAGRNGGGRSARSTPSRTGPLDALDATFQVMATGISHVQSPTKGNAGIASPSTAKEGRSTQGITPRSPSREQPPRPGTSLGSPSKEQPPRPGTSLGSPSKESSPRADSSLGSPSKEAREAPPRPGTSLGILTSGCPPARPKTSMGLADSSPTDISPNKRTSLSKEHPSVSRSFCSTELPSTTRSLSMDRAAQKSFFSTEVDESLDTFEGFDDSFMVSTAESVYKSKDLHLVPISQPSQPQFNAEQSGPGIISRLEKEICSQSAKLRVVKEQGVSSRKPDPSFPASLQKIRFQEHRFLLDQLVVEHGKHLEILTKYRDLEQMLRTERRLREELEAKQIEELKWRQETRANLEAKDKYLTELIEDQEEKMALTKQEMEEKESQIKQLESHAKALKDNINEHEQQKRTAMIKSATESQRLKKQIATLQDSYTKLDRRLNDERHQRSFWEEKAGGAEQQVEDLKRSVQEEVEKTVKAEKMVQEGANKTSQECMKFLDLLEEEKEQRSKERERYEREIEQIRTKAEEETVRVQEKIQNRALDNWTRFAFVEIKLGLCRRVLIAQKFVENEEKRALQRDKMQSSMKGAVQELKLDKLMKDNKSLEAQNAELKMMLGGIGNVKEFREGVAPEDWGISVSQLKEFRDEIMDDMIQYCNCHKFYKPEDEEHDGIHICCKQPCPYKDDHRGVQHVEECEFISDGTEKYGPLLPNMHVVVDRYIKPLMKETGQSLALTKNPQGRPISVFVTHSWDGLFSDFVNTLEQTLDDQEVVWVCSFALPQLSSSDIKQQLNEELTKTPFALALQEALKHVVVIDDDLHILKRVWCLYELSRGLKLGVPVFLRSSEPKTLLELRIRVNELNVKTASASHFADKKRIDDEIEKQGGYEDLNRYVINCIRERSNILFDGECLEALRKMDQMHEQIKLEPNKVKQNRLGKMVQELATTARRQQARAFDPGTHDKMLKDHEAKLQKLLEYHDSKLRSLDNSDDENAEVIQLKQAKRRAELEVLANKREQSMLSKISQMNDDKQIETKTIVREEVDDALRRHFDILKLSFEEKMCELLDEKDKHDNRRFQQVTSQVLKSIQVSRTLSPVDSSSSLQERLRPTKSADPRTRTGPMGR